jgi:hypothetical protein
LISHRAGCWFAERWACVGCRRASGLLLWSFVDGWWEVNRWVWARRRGGEAGVSRDEFVGPGPVVGDTQDGAPGGPDDPCGHVQEAVAQLLRFGQGVLAVQ